MYNSHKKKLFLIPVLLFYCHCFKKVDILKTYPYEIISNEKIKASVFLPDAEKGFYRSTRFEWSGMIYELTYKGHSYFLSKRQKYSLPLRQKHNPLKTDHAASLADQFQNGPERVEEAETYMVIGVGNLNIGTNEIVDPGVWETTKGNNWIEFVHELQDSSGYGYRYTKHMELIEDKPELSIYYTLKNSGSRKITAEQYNHNFFTIDDDYIGRSYELELFFEPRFTTFHPEEFKKKKNFIPFADINDKKIVFLQPFISVEEGIFSVMGGYDSSISHNHAVIRNKRTRAGVDISGDFPLSGFHFWADKSTICPEFFIGVSIEPGKTQNWTRTYKFFVK